MADRKKGPSPEEMKGWALVSAGAGLWYLVEQDGVRTMDGGGLQRFARAYRYVENVQVDHKGMAANRILMPIGLWVGAEAISLRCVERIDCADMHENDRQWLGRAVGAADAQRDIVRLNATGILLPQQASQ
jgi:hypothetical protein